MAVDYASAEAALAARLGERGLEHSRRVAQTASELATVYGVDPEKARIAGLLHDWDRERAHADLVSAAVAAGMQVDEADFASPYLLHAKTGALAVREAFPGLSDDVVDAIVRHTVGTVPMTDLDMVVWIADTIEPGRDHETAEGLRGLVGAVPLDELFARGYQESLLHIVRERKPIHPDTVAVWNALVARRSR